ncbi:hypothetical protein MATL_G00072080 [Megalops atlanticus]|uniref:Uncharacterized protein n=1 Tax=Megalops atlanticus TaxID=7932 RepID=A0A9D3T900_MEGAT|nr:hypothetical protein MATL_G00072080 [Megalops atlanticus]
MSIQQQHKRRTKTVTCACAVPRRGRGETSGEDKGRGNNRPICWRSSLCAILSTRLEHGDWVLWIGTGANQRGIGRRRNDQQQQTEVS